MRAFISLMLLTLLLLAFHSPASGAAYPRQALIGLPSRHAVEPNESLMEIARRYDVGYNEIIAANPGLDPFIPPTGTSVTLPTSWLLPAAANGEGIVINLSELRLYLLFTTAGTGLVATFPIGIGSEGHETPTGTFNIREKIVNPPWHVPPSIRKERPELPPVIPSGPDNPLGSHALRLSADGILIHGTNRPWGTGREVSHGCIRLYPEDIPRLFRLVRVGTPVTIVREPVKIGEREGRVYLEVHDEGGEVIDYLEKATGILGRLNLVGRVNINLLGEALRMRTGIPVDITR
ncbi:L,D-transpeptidase family protein [Geomobilimonas luticola]|uniref:L,D-transpeptidase family protein n=1 Tax=Geomobilimonas luticola TaxID=1114878 RepID=A0ABS5SFB4_9BACT|nr:L,D-transpeptidase family protein [Geomobilimonas luticola]MBT0653204.1 L,D-transpeptidase family protein [Geomobilimonas luticola]